MKKILMGLGIAVIISGGITTTAIGQGKGNKNKGNEQHDKGNHKEKEDHQDGGKNHGNGKHEMKVEHQEKHVVKNVGQHHSDNKGHNNKGNDDKINGNGNGNNGKGNNGNNDNAGGKHNDKNDNDGFAWNDENFKNRKELKNKEKVAICHKTKDGNDGGVTINVSSHAVKAHMNHGDAMGTCPVVKNSPFSNSFMNKRTDYYNTLQNTQEQVIYSRSILDYALMKLNSSRAQVVTLKTANMPQADIERKQATVVELEQNVSLLQTLVGVAAEIVVSKLQ